MSESLQSVLAYTLIPCLGVLAGSAFSVAGGAHRQR